MTDDQAQGLEDFIATTIRYEAERAIKSKVRAVVKEGLISARQDMANQFAAVCDFLITSSAALQGEILDYAMRSTAAKNPETHVSLPAKRCRL